MIIAIFVAFALTFISSGTGLLIGPQDMICYSMYPQHGVQAQVSPPPYKVRASKNTVKQGENVSIFIEGIVGFSDFLVEVRNQNGEPVGRFNVKPNDPKLITLNCGGRATAVGQKTFDSNKNITLNWTAPTEEGAYKILATIVRQFDIFWVQIPGTTLRVIKN